MKQITLPNYTELSHALQDTTLKLNPSQVHGAVCGIFCANSDSNAWKELTAEDGASTQAQRVFQTLYDVTTAQLKDGLFEFQLVLPLDTEVLATRAEALTLWCQGFLTGLKLGGVPIEHREPNEVTEAINDLIEIAKMQYEDVVDSEEDESAYTELVEYVRVAVILIYQDLLAPDMADASQSEQTKPLH